jgi:DNA repair protein RecO (recombination protein O)
MKFTDIGTILSLDHKQEGMLLLKILSRENGICAGIIRKPSKKMMTNYQVGNLIKFERFARLPNQLGTLSCEIEKSYQAQIISSKKSLYAFKSLSKIILSSFMEYQHHDGVFEEFIIFLNKIENFPWDDYCKIELAILKEAGYELDFRNCAGCESTSSLIYLSPKSGRSVCKTCSSGYEKLLLALPNMESGKISYTTNTDLIKIFDICEYFFKRYVWKENDFHEICFFRNSLRSMI